LERRSRLGARTFTYPKKRDAFQSLAMRQIIVGRGTYANCKVSELRVVVWRES